MENLFSVSKRYSREGTSFIWDLKHDIYETKCLKHFESEDACAEDINKYAEKHNIDNFVVHLPK